MASVVQFGHGIYVQFATVTINVYLPVYISAWPTAGPAFVIPTVDSQNTSRNWQ